MSGPKGKKNTSMPDDDCLSLLSSEELLERVSRILYAREVTHFLAAKEITNKTEKKTLHIFHGYIPSEKDALVQGLLECAKHIRDEKEDTEEEQADLRTDRNK